MSNARPKKRRRLEIEPEGFQHTPLDLSKPCIRLFRFLPKLEGEDYLRLEIVNNVALDDKTVYRALSYEWGPPKPTQDLIVNQKILSVRKNLHDFLESLYAYHGGADTTAYFWSDAICIRQDDTEEKNHQVGQMARVYESTIEALAWLGQSESTYIGKLFEALQRGCTTVVEEYGLDVVLHHDDEDLWRVSFEEIWCDADLHDAFIELCFRSYWKRLWIVQELTLAPRVRIIHSRYSLDWTFLRMIFQGWSDEYDELYGSRLGACETIVMWTHDQHREGRRWGTGRLLQAMSYFSDFDCLERLDRVYGLLGLTQQQALFSVNYNVTPTMLFLDVVKATLIETDLYMFQRLAEALDIVVTCVHGRVWLQSRGDTSKSALRSPKRGLVSNRTSNAERLDFTDITTGQKRVLETSSEWRRAKLPERGMGPDRYRREIWHGLQQNVVRVLRMMKEQRCQCCLCESAFSDEQAKEARMVNESSVDIYSIGQGIVYLRKRELNVFVAFHEDRYLATLVTYGEGGLYSEAAVKSMYIIFRDPYHQLWEVEPEGILVPLISTLVILSHVELWLRAEHREEEWPTMPGIFPSVLV